MNPSLPRTPLAQSPDFSERDFRHALGQFATGVTVVTARGAEGSLVGVTVSSFNAVSLHPPLVLWSMGRSSGALPAFEHCSHYAVQVLSAQQLGLARQFASRGVDRFAGVPFRFNAQGVPLLDGVLATFECCNRSRYAEGDHTIFVGEVEHCHHRTDLAPLLYHGGHLHAEHALAASGG